MIERQVDCYINLRVTTNQKSVIDKHTKREKNLNITLELVIKSQRERAKEWKRHKQELQKQSENKEKMAISTYISIIANCKGTKISNQRT